MAKSSKLEAALEQIKEMQRLETLSAGDAVALRKIFTAGSQCRTRRQGRCGPRGEL